PRAAASSQTPIPTWIQTAAAPACTGWYDHAVPAQLTRCLTQPGDPSAAGAMTWPGSPAAIAGCACRMPSKTQSNPNPIRATARPTGSGGRPPRPAPRLAKPGSHSRALAQMIASETKISSATSPWRISAERKAVTRIELDTFRPLRMPGIGLVLARLAMGCMGGPASVTVRRASGYPQPRRRRARRQRLDRGCERRVDDGSLSAELAQVLAEPRDRGALARLVPVGEHGHDVGLDAGGVGRRPVDQVGDRGLEVVTVERLGHLHPGEVVELLVVG